MATTTNTKSCDVVGRNFDWCPGRPELPGVLGDIYYAPLYNIVKKPKYKDMTEDGRPTTAELTGNFEMAEGKTFHKICCLPRKNHYTSESQGELPSQTQNNKLDAIIPSTAEEASAIGAVINNIPIVVVFRDASGRARVLGIGFQWAQSTFAQDSGEDATGQVQSTLHVESSDLTVAPFYNGTLPLPGGDEISFGSDN
ncbi:MAG: hypothetical protein K2H86_06065 [Muribaculaceae bacterium]|nr:hypothetical protein [Muribaculaceae bacterium]